MIIMPATIKKRKKIIKKLRFRCKKWMMRILQRMSLQTLRMSSKDLAILIMTLFRMLKTYIIQILDPDHSLILVRLLMLTRSIDLMVMIKKIKKSSLMTSTSKLHVTLLTLNLMQIQLLMTLKSTH
jgi:hypothetical protein